MTPSPQQILERTAVVIPAYNASAHLRDVIEATAREVPKAQIIVVDDGSTDGTDAVARSSGVRLVSHEVNRGKGRALRTGYEEAARLGFEFAITLDADGQHNPEEIGKFLELQSRTGADLILGNRMADRSEMPFIRVFANWTSSAVISLKTGTNIPDSQNGYRMIRTALYRRLDLVTERYDTESEIIIRSAKLGARIESIPVQTIYGKEKSAVNPIVDSFRFFRMVLRSLFW